MIVGSWVRSDEVTAICRALDDVGVANALTYSIADIAADPHYAARENIVSVDNPRIGPVKMQGVGPKFSVTPAGPISSAPALGENTHEVLVGLLGLDDSVLKELTSSGVI